MNRVDKQGNPGFTIVELLIVVVVIAILAAITIVGYTGISNRAKASAASSAAEQAAKKVITYAVTNADTYPSTLSDSGVTDGNGISYQYSVNNAANPKTFCLTATTNNISYFISSSTPSPAVGACNGHGANGGSVITNIVSTNPSVETGTTAGWGADFGSGGAGITSVGSGGAAVGTKFYRMQWTTASTQAYRGASIGIFPVSANQVYTGSISVRTNRTQGMMICFLYVGTNGSGTTQPCSSSVSVPANTWRRLSVSAESDPAAVQVIIRVYASSDSLASPWQVNDTLDVDAAMITSGGTVYNYGDGDSQGWAWTGAANASPSTGPPL